MRFGTRRASAAVFVVLSLLYIAFALSVEQRRMIGDDRGWDPGSRALPLGAGAVMLAASLFLVVRERAPAGDRERLPTPSRRLIALAIVVSLLYVFAFRAVGFVLGTNLLLLTLITFNTEGDVRIAFVPRFAAAVGVGTAFVLVIYTLGRLITRSLFFTGRRMSSDLLQAPVFTAAVSLAAVAVVFLAIVLGVRRRLPVGPARRLLDTMLTAAGTTELLYLVFRQVFLVRLAQGLVRW